MQQLASSYRDNNGFVFVETGTLLRYIHPQYLETYNYLMESGLYEELTKKKWLVPHQALAFHELVNKNGGIVIQPEKIPFISYAYEWPFDMWRDAAVLTLDIALAALKKDMILKDATPFNVQFANGLPIFIDTLSFDKYDETQPWIAYRQFCESFLAPLLLMHYQHPDLGKLFTLYPNGIPLEVVVKLLPGRSKWNINCYLHIHLQANAAKKAGNAKKRQQIFSRKKMEVLLNGLRNYVNNLSLKKAKTTWDDYYSETILGKEYFDAKVELVKQFTDEIEFTTAIDLGANDGPFSKLLKEKAALVIATDFDPNCINHLYQQVKKEKIDVILPLVVDLLSPSPAIGWNNVERSSINERFRSDLVMALALVHHLAIAKNVPLHFIADWLHPMATYLIIEFVPKQDEKVQLLLQNREDIFDDYTLENFKTIFERKYDFLKEATVGNTNRLLFLMKRK